MIYKKYCIISGLHYAYLVKEFSDTTTSNVLAVRIAHAEATI